MNIEDVLRVAGLGAFASDDQAAIRGGALRDGYFYTGLPPVTPGYRQVRQPSESISILLALEDGTVMTGSGVTVQYAGTAGREPVLDASEACAHFAPVLREALIGRSADSFRESSDRVNSSRLPAAVAYGVSPRLK
jgi:methylaspartate ammonia-lyase